MKNLLYYPTIEFKQSDYASLWSASLLWDKIYRIVPDGYTPNDPRNIVEICSTGEIGIPISPTRYGVNASSKFNENLSSGYWNAAALQFQSEDVDKYKNYIQLHKNKIDVSLLNMNILSGSIYDNNDDWLYVSQELANHYMIYLATEIAESNNLSLCTDNADVWTTSNFFIHDTSIQEGYFPGQDYTEPSESTLSSLFFNNILPSNILDISPDKILKFREKRKDERKQFQIAIENFSNNLSLATDPKILEQIISEERNKVEYALTEYKKSMDILNVVKWGGYITTATTIITDALGYTSFENNVIQGITSTGIGIGLVTGLLERKFSKPYTPYSYLASINSLSEQGFSKYNYQLYKKMEEFIND